ncbi:MAG: T9SS type B sorting domain-containing protein [Bacteroidales bacterium]|nr:T9SS type B sorting domain-containing protein [Bacteroidales bacterium]MBN2819292.1 T9SS type B sorting domain-containing protein [Bacteroidales bacterium]
MSHKNVLFYIILTVLSILNTNPLHAQALFTAADTVCIDDSLIIVNQSREAASYYWNFCSGNLAYIPEGENLSNSGTLNGPAFIDFAEDNEVYYAFITNHNDGTVTRNTYGADFLSEPTSVNMGNLGGALPRHLQGIQVVHDNSEWYVFVIGGQREESRLVRLDFGNSLANNSPAVNNLGNIGALDYPVDLYLESVDGTWIGFTVNKNTNTTTRFVFTGGLDSPPIGENLGNPASLNSPCGILPIYENGNWYMFISNYDGHEISRLEFGSSLLSTPSGSTIGGSAVLHYPFDLTILRDCERTYGFVLNRFNDIVRMEFYNGLNSDPEFTSLGEIGSLYNPQGISDVFRVGDTLFTFVANIDNSTLTRMYFPGCTNANPASSTERNPPPVFYDEPGTYNVNLVIDEGLPQQENYCLNVVVLDSPEFSLGNDTIIPAGTSIELSPDSVYSAYDWSTGSAEQTITVSNSGIYSLTITNHLGCKADDEIEVILDIGIPNFFTPNGDGYNDTWLIPFLLNEPDAEIFVFDRFGNTVASYKAEDGEWDGTSSGRSLPEGTYWYLISVPEIKKPYKGQVTIKR